MFNNIETNNNILKRRFKYLIAPLIVLLFATLGNILFLSHSSHAADMQLTNTTDKSIQKLLLNRSLAHCLKNDSLSGGTNFDRFARISGTAAANSGEWFSTGGVETVNPTTGPFLSDTRFGLSNSQSTETGCGNKKLIKMAIDSLGKSGVEVLCSSGFKRSDNSDCLNGNGEFMRSGSKDASQAAFIKSFPEQALSDEGWYWFYRKTFNWSCGYGKMSNPVSKAIAEADSRFGYTIHYVTTDGTTEPKYFIGAKNRSDQIKTRLGENGNSTVTRTCAQIENHIKEYAQKYEAFVKVLGPVGVSNNQADSAPEGVNGENAQSATTCAVEAVGWIVCPVFSFLSGIVDAAYGFVTGLLEVQPLLTTGVTSGTYEAWKVMRNIANVAFVIAFLIIIFSQLTSFGVSNYGVKKLLPRLVISAILVNISFWVCAIGIDISNILGSSTATVFQSVAQSIPSTSLGSGIGDSFAEVGPQWNEITTVVLAGAATAAVVYYIGLAALIPALLGAVVAILTVFLVLTLRQALIILLIVVSPLAFVAFLLPNTEDLFTKWRKLFMTLLLMFPIIAGLFGASALASQIIMNSSDDMVVQIMGAAIAIIPLALTPIIMKTAGGVLNRFAGFVNNAERGPVDRLKKAGANWGENRRNMRDARALGGSFQGGRGAFVRYKSRRNAVSGGREAEMKRANTEYVAGEIQKNERFRKGVAGGDALRGASDGAMQRALSSAVSAQSKLKNEEISAASTLFQDALPDSDEAMQLALATGPVTTKQGKKTLNGATSTAVRQAAIQHIVATNDIEKMTQLWDASQKWESDEGNELRETLASSIRSSGARPAFFGMGAIGNLEIGTHKGSTETITGAIKAGAYSPAKISSADPYELNKVIEIAADAASKGDTSLQQLLQKDAAIALKDPILSKNMGKNRSQVAAIAGPEAVAAAEQTLRGAATSTPTASTTPTGTTSEPFVVDHSPTTTQTSSAAPTTPTPAPAPQAPPRPRTQAPTESPNRPDQPTPPTNPTPPTEPPRNPLI